MITTDNTKRFELLHTERLLLRRPTAQDANAIFSTCTQKDVTKYLLFPPHISIHDTLNFIQWRDEQWEKKGGYHFIVCSKADDGRVIGGVGLSVERLDEGSKESDKYPVGVARIGYYIAKEQWGKGYATEACKKMIELAVEVGITKLVAPVHPDNLASIRVLEKCGFQEDAMTCETMVLFPNLGKEKSTLVGFVRSLSLSDPPPTLTWED